METHEITILVSWCFVYLTFALIAWIKNRQKQDDKLGRFPLEELTVIVPFRNEAENLGHLCDSILKQTHLPKKIVFVDDHSDDKGANIIDTKLENSQIPYEIITLNDVISGKKQAIMVAVNLASTQYCQTIDADVWFEKDFFGNLPTPSDIEMQILPVRMVGSSLFTKILELEYGSFQILQALVKREKPLMASGANLIFKRDIYLSYNQLEKHKHRSSGDDQYALAQFINNNRKIKTYFDLRLATFTETPQSLGELFRQRVRWMGNNTQGNDVRATLFSVVIFGLNLTFLLSLIYFLTNTYFVIAFLLIGIRFLLDVLLYAAWFNRNNTWQLMVFMPLLSLFYPIYLILLPFSFLLFGSNLNWKKRKIRNAVKNKS